MTNKSPHLFLVNYFRYHRLTTMHQQFDYDDMCILRSRISRLLQLGYTEAQIKRIIDSFFATPMGSIAHPARMFASKKAQLMIGSPNRDESVDKFLANACQRTVTRIVSPGSGWVG